MPFIGTLDIPSEYDSPFTTTKDRVIGDYCDLLQSWSRVFCSGPNDPSDMLFDTHPSTPFSESNNGIVCFRVSVNFWGPLASQVNTDNSRLDERVWFQTCYEAFDELRLFEVGMSTLTSCGSMKDPLHTKWSSRIGLWATLNQENDVSSVNDRAALAPSSMKASCRDGWRICATAAGAVSILQNTRISSELYAIRRSIGEFSSGPWKPLS